MKFRTVDTCSPLPNGWLSSVGLVVIYRASDS